VLRLGDEHGEDAMGKRVAGRLRVDHVELALDGADPALHHELTDEPGGKAEAGRPRVQAGPAGSIFVCDKEVMVSQQRCHAP
jgi:hypothetical protein